MQAIELFGDKDGETTFKVPMQTDIRGGDWATEGTGPGRKVVAVTLTSLNQQDEVDVDTFVIPLPIAAMVRDELDRVIAETEHG